MADNSSASNTPSSNEYVSLVNKKLRSLRKKVENANKLEAKKKEGRGLTDEQTKFLATKQQLERSFAELDKIRGKLAQIAEQEQKRQSAQPTAATAPVTEKEQPAAPKAEAPTPAPQPTIVLSDDRLVRLFVNLIHFHTNEDAQLSHDFSEDEIDATHRLAHFISNSQEDHESSFTLAKNFLTSSSVYHYDVTYERIRDIVGIVGQRKQEKLAPSQPETVQDEKTEEEPPVHDEVAKATSQPTTSSPWINELDEEESAAPVVEEAAQPAASQDAKEETLQPAESIGSPSTPTETEFREQTGRSAIQSGRGRKFRGNSRGGRGSGEFRSRDGGDSKRDSSEFRKGEFRGREGGEFRGREGGEFRGRREGGRDSGEFRGRDSGEFRGNPRRPTGEGRPERTDRPERSDRPERTDRPERSDRPEDRDGGARRGRLGPRRMGIREEGQPGEGSPNFRARPARGGNGGANRSPRPQREAQPQTSAPAPVQQ